MAKRFYDAVTCAGDDAGGVAVLLDGRPVRTPAKAALSLPSQALAEAVAAEWAAQGERIAPETMPLTKLANTALDGVRGREHELVDDILSYVGSDLICYRAAEPQQLAMKQMAAWDPVLQWLEQALGARFELAIGVTHAAQPEESLARVRAALASHDAFALAALHTMTTLMGSALLALAHAAGLYDCQAVWQAAHIDEDWNISQWGEDAEAKERRLRRWEEMQAASRFFGLASR